MGNSSGGKKTGTSRKSSSTSKRTVKSTAKRKSSQKPKVYIPAYKAFILCAGVILVCVLLLLAANLIQAKKNANKIEPPSITQRFEQDDKKSDLNQQNQANRENQTASSNKNTQNSQTNTNRTNTTTSSDKTNTANSTRQNSTGTTNSSNTANQQNKNTQNAQNTLSNQNTQTNQNNQNNQKTQQNQTSTQNKTTTQSTSTEIKPNTGSEIASNKIDNKPEPVKADSKFNFPAAKNKAQLIFVFDDGGQNIQHLNKFLELPFPITVAVLPQITHSKESAQMVRKSGNELILHQPMQSVNASINPGPGAITPQMSENQVISTLFTNINEIGPIEGMNNHEGSAITADAEMMSIIMKIASEEGIFFLDSRTNVETKVPYVAREMGYSYYERNIFLDNEKTRANVLSELNKGLALANKNGSVIMIGHIWSADFLPAILKEAYPELLAKGYTFSTVSKSRARKN